MTPELAVYGGLFLAALVAATIFPGQSEAMLVALLLAGHAPLPLLVSASAGNILGSVCNWGLGRGIEKFRDRSWFPAKAETLEKTQRWYLKYGKWSLLMSWAPIVGDPLTIVAGVMREPFPMFLFLVAVAKIGRYLVLTAVTLNYFA